MKHLKASHAKAPSSFSLRLGVNIFAPKGAKFFSFAFSAAWRDYLCTQRRKVRQVYFSMRLGENIFTRNGANKTSNSS